MAFRLAVCMPRALAWPSRSRLWTEESKKELIRFLVLSWRGEMKSLFPINDTVSVKTLLVFNPGAPIILLSRFATDTVSLFSSCWFNFPLEILLFLCSSSSRFFFCRTFKFSYSISFIFKRYSFLSVLSLFFK